MMQSNARKQGGFDLDILEWNVPEEVLAVLLKDRSTGRNLIWATDDYAARGKGFGANDEMQVAQIVDKDHPVIRPRVDKNAEEQRQRSVKRAEVFTPSWICNKQNNLVDAAWFGWKKPDSSPFNIEIDLWQGQHKIPQRQDMAGICQSTAFGGVVRGSPISRKQIRHGERQGYSHRRAHRVA